MRNLMAVLTLTLALPCATLADGWEGKWVKIKQGTVLCGYLADVDAALALVEAGASMDSTSCALAPKEMLAVVIRDYSTLGDYYRDDLGYMEVMIEAQGQQARAWAKTEHLDCCYTKN